MFANTKLFVASKLFQQLTYHSIPCRLHSSLTGALPHSFGKLANLVELRLGSNLFSGQLKSFDDFVNLIQLDLSGTHQSVVMLVSHQSNLLRLLLCY